MSKRIRARYVHSLEGLIDNVVGYVQNYILVLAIFNGVFGYGISWTDNLIGGSIIFVISWIRKYYIRRKANSIINNLYKPARVMVLEDICCK